MAKYAIWDKKSDIYTNLPHHITGKTRWSASEYISEVAPWAGLPGAKVIISGSAVNGGFFLDFYERAGFYKAQGVSITDDMNDGQALAAMEAYDNSPPEPDSALAEMVEALSRRVDTLTLRSLGYEVETTAEEQAREAVIIDRLVTDRSMKTETLDPGETLLVSKR